MTKEEVSKHINDYAIECQINFLYWLHNFRGPFTDIVENAFESQHLTEKWKGIQKDADVITPGLIIKFFMELDNKNKAILFDYCNSTYYYK